LENDFPGRFDFLFSLFLAGYQAGNFGWVGWKIKQDGQSERDTMDSD
jgi:hypothetical protein